MNDLVRRTFKQVEIAFGFRGKPRSISHCTMCYKDEEIARLIATPYPSLTVEDLRPLLWDGYMCWGTWPEIAYYVPCLLEFYAANRIPDEEQLYAKLLLAVRPELGMMGGVPEIVEEMSSEERRSVFQFVTVVLENRLAEETESNRAWILSETLGFLTAFDEPIALLLTRLAQSENPRTRANFCLFLADKTLSSEPFSNMWLNSLTMLPENEKALDNFLDPSHVASYLLKHVADVTQFGTECEAEVSNAFDWAMAQQEAL